VAAPLKQIRKFLDGKTSLPDDRPEGASFEIMPGMNWNRHSSPPIVWIRQNVMTADDSIDHKSRFQQCADNRSAVYRRQPRAAHN